MRPSLRVLVAEDTMLTREGIVRLLLDAGLNVVGQVADAPSLMREVADASPDVVVADIRMPPTQTDEGLTAAIAIRQEYPEVGVLVLSQHVEPSYALRLLKEQPAKVGYLLKERIFDPAVHVDALHRIRDCETVIDPTIVSRLLGRQRARHPLDPLSPREREVPGLVAEGLSNQALAARLHVTERTVEAHSTQVFSKLGLVNDPATHLRVLAALTYLRT